MYEIYNVGAVSGGEAFLLINENGSALIDSGFAFCADEMTKNVEMHLNGRPLDAILLTHSHYDHASGIPCCRKKWPNVKVYAAEYAQKVFTRPGAIKTIREMNDNAAKLFGHADYPRSDSGLYVDIPVYEGDSIKIGNMEFTVLETPGHTMDSISFWCSEHRFLISAETIGYPLLPEKIVPTFLVGYSITIDSIRRLRALKAESQLVSHLGSVGRAFSEEFLSKAEIWMKKTRDMILSAHVNGLDNTAIMKLLKYEFYTGEIIRLQPEKAFDLNAHYMVNMIIKECAQKTPN